MFNYNNNLRSTADIFEFVPLLTKNGLYLNISPPKNNAYCFLQTNTLVQGEDSCQDTDKNTKILPNTDIHIDRYSSLLYP